MAKKISSLYIDDTSIRLLVTRGDRPKAWGKARLKPGFIDGLIVNEPVKVAEIIIKLLKEHKVSQRKMMVGIGAEQVLTRQMVLPSLPKAMLAEAVIREARRLLPLPPEELYLSWQTIRAVEDKMYVFLLGLRRNSIDSVFKTLRIAKIKTAALTIKPLALAQLFKEPNAILIDAQQADFDIIIQMNGIPQLIRTVSFPSTSAVWKEKAPLIIDEVDRTIKFYASNNPEKPLPNDLPMYVSGDLAGQSELCLELNSRFGYYCSQLIPQVTPTAGFSAQTYLTNISMNSQQSLSTWNMELSVTNMNLLPEDYRIKPVKWGRVLAAPAGLAVLAIVVPLVMVTSGASASITAMRNQLQATNQVLQTKQAQQLVIKKDIKTLQDKLVQTQLANNDCTNLLKTLNQTSETINSDLRIVNGSLPDRVSLTSISYGSESFSVAGTGPDETAILSYARSLNTSGRFKQVIVNNITAQAPNPMRFNLILNR